jgi:hypothetical protein
MIFKFAGEVPTLKELQEAVGGYIEIVAIPSTQNAIMIVDEEGLMKGSPLNPIASTMALRDIVGDVIILPRSLMR